MKKHSTVEEYIKSFPEDTQKKLQDLRIIISEVAPTATETIKYNISTFLMNGTYLIYFSGNKKHIGLYPIPKGNEIFQKKIERYKSGKSTIQFSLDAPLPKSLIKEIVKNAIIDAKNRIAKKQSK